jgi:hypothetical protein
MQNQTAECLVIGEILTPDLVVVLNKIDLIPEPERASKLKEIREWCASVAASAAHPHRRCRWAAALSKTRFASAPIVAVAAFAHQGDADVNDESHQLVTQNLAELVSLIRNTTKMPSRLAKAQPVYLSVDHGFPIKGGCLQRAEARQAAADRARRRRPGHGADGHDAGGHAERGGRGGDPRVQSVQADQVHPEVQAARGQRAARCGLPERPSPLTPPAPAQATAAPSRSPTWTPARLSGPW